MVTGPFIGSENGMKILGPQEQQEELRCSVSKEAPGRPNRFSWAFPLPTACLG